MTSPTARAIRVAVSAAGDLRHGPYWPAVAAACRSVADTLSRGRAVTDDQITTLRDLRPSRWARGDAPAAARRAVTITLRAALDQRRTARAAASLAADVTERLTQQREEALRSGPTAYAEVRPIAREARRAAHTAALTEILGETNG